MADYLPHTDDEVARDARVPRLSTRSTTLFAAVPAALRLAGGLDLDGGSPEPDVAGRVRRRSPQRNRPVGRDLVCFAGAGAYDHEVPAVVRALASRSEFVTAYTPYQPEVAQGVLQAIFEYQTMVARLSGLPIANASLYDGASALVEALNLCTRRDRPPARVLLSSGVHPHWRAVGGHLRARDRPRARRGARSPTGATDWELARRGRRGRASSSWPSRTGSGASRTSRPREARATPHGALLVVCADPIAARRPALPGRARRRRGRRRGPGARHAAELRRSVPRAVRLLARRRSGASRAASSGETSDVDGTRGLRHDAARARAGHPPREGDLERLHQPDADGGHRGHPARAGWARRASPRSRRAPRRVRTTAATSWSRTTASSPRPAPRSCASSPSCRRAARRRRALAPRRRGFPRRRGRVHPHHRHRRRSLPRRHSRARGRRRGHRAAHAHRDRRLRRGVREGCTMSAPGGRASSAPLLGARRGADDLRAVRDRCAAPASCERPTCRRPRSPSSSTSAFLREVPVALPGGLRARPGRSLHAALAPAVLRRPRGLPARLVHDEVQPEGLRRDRRACTGLADVHPATPPRSARAGSSCSCDLERELCEITGMHVGDPAAGGRRRRRADRPPAHARVPRRERRVASTKVIIPDSAHGTNPASVTLGGYEVVTVPSDDRGLVDVDALRGRARPRRGGHHAHQPEHARPLRRGDRRDRRRRPRGRAGSSTTTAPT